ncbi:MAG TPA: PLP-dependent lyase/thiolase [Thermoleophilaceae bacterium]|nr:PLP-dependent lyase/thiolase [Thermoleophilaceae bacterium]
MAGLPTPLEEAPPSLAGERPLYLKREDVHELGAFKWRGALPALEAFRERGAAGVVTASTGNHGAASAWAAGRLGMRAVVFVPEEASEAKLGLLEQLGAELHRVGADLDESKELAREHAGANDLPFFEDGAEPAQFDGYEAIGEEILEQLGQPPARVIVPVGNGALLIGVARAVQPVLGVVAKEAPVMALSVEAGHPVECDRAATFADGMAVRVAIPLAVEEIRRAAPVPMAMVSERAIARAVGDFAAAGIRVEGSGAAALAAFRELSPDDGATVLIVTGRNIDDELHRRAVEDPDSFPD